METETKPKIDVKKVLITLALVLVTAGSVGGGVYYVLNQNFKKECEANEKALSEIKDQVDKLSQENKTDKTPSSDETASWKTYNATSYSFKYPSSEWTVPAVHTGPGFVLCHTNGDCLNVLNETDERNMGLEGYIKFTYNVPAPQNFKSVTLNQNTGVSYDSVYSDNSNPSFKNFAFDKNKLIVTFTLNNTKAQAVSAEGQRILGLMAKTLTFN